jgi:trk system potassium uptake protein
MKTLFKKHPATPILAGFLFVIISGTVLLKLPVSTANGYITWIDAFFTATSAVCVTGLIVVDTGSYFSVFGQIVILSLFQIGGLGVMTIAVLFFQWIGKQISLQQRILVQDLYSVAPRKDIFRLVSSVVIFTFTAEIIGMLLLYIRWSHTMPVRNAWFHSIFHSISAFCNAGFSLNSDSMIAHKSDALINLTMCCLIIAGGIGFPVLYDLAITFRNRKKRLKLTVQTRVVLVTTFVLIVGGALIFGILERHSPDVSASLNDRVLTALFQSVTCRTAGFNTVDIGALKSTTIMMAVFLMFFGASPGSCGGGVKTTTLAILSGFVISRFKRSKYVNIFRKTIPLDTVNRSMALVVISALLICVTLFAILSHGLLTESSGLNQQIFLACLFETVSAFGTVGLSMGITSELNTSGKLWIILMMIIGRLGVLTFAYLIVGKSTEKHIEYAEENIMIG